MLIIFRVFSNSNSGLGHITRCVVLAKELIKQNITVEFITDSLDESVLVFLEGIPFHNLYDSVQGDWDEKQDALLVKNWISKRASFYEKPISWIIVDHYYLSATWEKCIQKNGFKILAIDDLVREHSAETVLDFKWRGKNAKDVYLPKVTNGTKLLLGPQYLLVENSEKPNKIISLKQDDTSFKLLIGLGGGGDSLFLIRLINRLISIISTQKNRFSIKVVVGPFLLNKDKLIKEFCDLNNPKISLEFIQGKNNLSLEYKWCDLYLGAAGGVLYQIRVLKKPAVLFSMSSSQNNKISHLNEIGQYFFIDNLMPDDEVKLSELVLLISTIYERIEQLYSKSLVSIDSLGAKRVVNFLLNGLDFQSKFNTIEYPYREQISEQYTIRPVIDSDINHYLQSRNLTLNRNNMIEESEIPRLDHYKWWFLTKRRSFLLSNKENELLYIWDELKQVDKKKYLIGGWFVCNEKASYQDAMLALDWQLKKCQKDYPGVIWLAVISRKNKYVKLLNDYFGFKEIEPSSRYSEIVEQLFPNADYTDFFYVYK